jgi:(1->4)-alpha-D-glucan 1-alpha-D-glucosylmutase
LKLFATMTMLRCRKDERQMFDDGCYEAIETQGTRAEHVFAFARTLGDRRVVIAAPRLVATLAPDPGVPPLGERIWGDTTLQLRGPASPALRGYRHVITGRCVPIRQDGTTSLRAADVFEHFPVAMLISERT